MSFKAMKGNKYIELLSTSNKMLMDQWKIYSGVQKEYDADSKTYVYNVGAKSPMAQMCLPKDKKEKLNLYYPLLVLQIYFPIKANILCDIGITLCNSQRKRITLSSNKKSKQNSSLFTVLPFVIENSNRWISVLVDIEEIVSTVWNNLKLKEIDFLSLSGVFRLKRIFLLSRDLIKFTEGGAFTISYDQLPKQMSLPKNIVEHCVYVSSFHNSPKECLKDGNISNEDASDTYSSGSSQRSTLDTERFLVPKVKTPALSELKLLPNFLTSSNTETHKTYEGNFTDLNLSMLKFSTGIEPRTLKEANSENLSIKQNVESVTGKNLNASILNSEQNIELWMPLCSSGNNDEIIPITDFEEISSTN